MVRGRRLKGAISYQKDNSITATANRKKRDNGLKLNETILNGNNKIKNYFNTLNNNVETDDQGCIKVGDVAPKITDLDIDQMKCDEVNLKLKPNTPHRIELRNDSTADVKLKTEDDDNIGLIYLPPKINAAQLEQQQQPKSKRKLNLFNETDKYGSITNHKLTEYFPVRRSVRKTKKTVLEEQQRTLEHIIRNNIEEGLKIKIFEDKGRGVIADKSFERGDFVVEYSGELIDSNEAKSREITYAQDCTKGCYMYYFKHGNQQYCIDATAETGRLGRLVNHSRNGNLITRTVSVDNKPRLILVAKETILAGTEVTYDYGDRSKESLKHHPWLAS